MIGQRGRRWARIALATVAGGALALGFAGPAAAEDPATGIAESTGRAVTLMLNGDPKRAGELALKIDGKRVPAFCIDFHTNVAINGEYQEGTWDESQVKNLGKVQWVLTHGYPNAEPATLLASAGATLPEKAEAEKLLYFGTQAAVWHFSDGITLGDWVDGRGLLAQREYDVVKKVHDHLVDNATDQPEPKAELTVDPTSAKATVGEKAGPFTVKGPAGEITLSVSGGAAVDADGKPVTTTTNGGRFWVTAEGAGEVKVTLSAKDSVSFGRVFLFTGGKAQKLILGGSTGAEIAAKAEAIFAAAPTPSAPAESPTPSPTTPAETPSPSAPADSPAPSTSPASNGGNLPLTGSPVATAITAGLVLLAAGAVVVLLVRRRKVRFTA